MRLAPESADKRKIVVDLTPLLPGGENGGAKVMILDLIARLGKLAPQLHFVLLTMSRTRDELRSLEAPNISCNLIAPPGFAARAVAGSLNRLPAGLRTRLVSALRALRARYRRSHDFLGHLGADLLFCPLTAPNFANGRTPVLSVVYDLQYAAYPHFFSDKDRIQRHFNFTQACKKSSQLVCISGFVRSDVLRTADIPPDKVKTIYIRLGHRLPKPAQPSSDAFLERLGITAERYLLYPANFWEHKNHRALLVAFNMFRFRNPRSTLKLVCTGAPGPSRDYYMSATRAMGLTDAVVFPGYVSDAHFSVLLYGCRALIFPSLFEGFGMPIIEAMAAGKPVACANVTSLPEVAQDAALFFDPKLPASVCEAIERLDGDNDLLSRLVERGRRNAERFTDPDEMAREYLALLQEMLPLVGRSV